MKKCKYKRAKGCYTKECATKCHFGLENGCRHTHLCALTDLECNEDCQSHKALSELDSFKSEKIWLQDAISYLKRSIANCNKNIAKAERKLKKLRDTRKARKAATIN